VSDFGFVKTSKFENGAWRGVARFVCSCGATHEQPLNRGGLNPEAIAKRAALAGWKADAFHASVATCPTCQAKDRRGEKPGEKPIMSTGMREPTPQERVKIRNVLDTYFDDAAGCWLDDFSDQKAGEQIGVPWAMVTRIREAAYGPIRVDPELVAMRNDHKRVMEQADKLAREMEKITKELAAMKSRLDDWTAKRTKAA
jgi:hypothetical protein